jgi:hypothetical protein
MDLGVFLGKDIVSHPISLHHEFRAMDDWVPHEDLLCVSPLRDV